MKGGPTHWKDASPTPLSIRAKSRNSYHPTLCAAPDRIAARVHMDMPAPTRRKGG